ncbi:MAG: RDD family protein [Dehalococcoidia bacterium]|nr:RDD family protein [Dehalococcoidia bacterium]
MNEAVQPQAAVTENVTGPRIVAGIIDVVILGILFVIMSMLFGDSESDSSSFSVNLSGLPGLIYGVLAFGYYMVLEATSGQTLGKKIMGLRVVSLEGEMSWGKSAIRTILRIIDGLPFLYLLGVILIAASKKNQRLGDMAAGTIVTRA